MGNLKKCSKCSREFPKTNEFFWKDKHRKDGFYYLCRECSGSKFEKQVKAKDGYKICSKCGNELPATLEYYGKDNNSKSGMTYACRKCLGSKYIKPVKEGYKLCNKCGRELPATLDYFNSRKEIPCGLSSSCKECRRSHSKKYRKENADKVAEYGRKHFQETKEAYREKRIEWTKEWRKRNPDKIKNYKIKYREENKEAIIEYNRLYNIKNRQKNIELCHIYNKEHKEDIANQRKQRYIENRSLMLGIGQKKRAKKAQLEHSFTAEDWENCLIYFKHKCAYCGKYSSKLQQDHFIPFAKDGPYTIDNIIPACKKCNCSKNANDFHEWYPMQKFYDKEREIKILEYISLMEEEKNETNCG